MDYEKKYNELVGKMKKAYLYTQTDSTKAVLEDILPELKESEDERIRKVLFGFFKCYKETGTCGSETFNGIPTDKILAWLEKQSEPKEYTFKSIPRLLDMIKPTERAKAYTKKLINTLTEEGYITDAKIVEDCLKQMNGEVVAMAVMDEKQGEQEPSWSEEDEHRAKDTIYFLDTAKKHYASTVELDACIDWVNSLKQRISYG